MSKNCDALIMIITATIAGAISMIANMALFLEMFGGNSNRENPLDGLRTILIALLGSFAVMLVQMAISRTRKYSADRLTAEICDRLLRLAPALGKTQ
jgi:heat shock protein HtpX